MRNRFLLFIVMIMLFQVGAINAQEAVTCGDIAEGIFVENREEHRYILSLSVGDSLTVRGKPLDDSLEFLLVIVGPNDLEIVRTGSRPVSEPYVETGRVAAAGAYTIRAMNLLIMPNGDMYDYGTSGGPGNFTLEIGCLLNDGTVINPGDTMPDPTPILPTRIPTSSPTDPTFFGFGGLEPVSFANASPLPLSVGVGTITPGNSEITAFNFEANAGDVMALDFTKLAGNLNLGLVVLSANNEVVFQASLVTSESLSTRLTLPSAGQYTIGVFRIDLLPPTNLEATAFQIAGTLNP